VVLDVGHVLRAGAEVGLHLGEEGVLAEIVSNQRRHERVDGLVVRDPGPRGVGQAHVALAVDVHEAGHAEQTVTAERQRIEEVVVDPAVDHVHLLLAPRGPHEDVVVLDDQVAPFDEHHAHLASQEGVLEVSGVRHAGREDHHHRLLAEARRGAQQGVEEKGRVVFDRPDPVVLEELRKDAIEGVAVLEHVGDARRTATVVLEHQVLAGAVPDDVGADDVREDLARRDHVPELALVLLARENELRRNDPILEALLALIDVENEEVQGRDALDQPRLQPFPLARRDDAGHEVEREDPLGALLLTVDGEGDALVHEREPLQTLAPLDLALREGLEDGDEGPVVLTGRPAPVERLVECSLLRHPFHAAKDSTDLSLAVLRPAIRSWMSIVVMVVTSEHGDGGLGSHQADGDR
jgi:hypothetical protein